MWPALCKEGVQLVVIDVFNSIQEVKDVENIRNEIKKYPNAQRHLDPLLQNTVYRENVKIYICVCCFAC